MEQMPEGGFSPGVAYWFDDAIGRFMIVVGNDMKFMNTIACMNADRKDK
jgi:hypothetical protein